MTWSLDGRPLRSVLVTRLRYLGDIAMTTVVLEALRRGDAEMDIGYLCEADYAPLLHDHPCLNRLHAIASRRAGKDASARRSRTSDQSGSGQGTWQVIRQIRKHAYDLSVDLFFNPRSAVLVRLGGSPGRIGGSRSLRRHLYTHTVFPPTGDEWTGFGEIAPGGLGDHLGRLAPLRHQESGKQFLDWCGEEWKQRPVRPRVAVPELAASQAAAELAQLGIKPGQDYILLAPGATWASKQWPVAHWISLIRILGEQCALPPVVLSPPTGDNQQGIIGSNIPAGCGGVLPRLDLSEALRVVGGATAVISVDGGIMHTAVAMGRPTVALFGPTSPEIWFPYETVGPFRVLATRPACHPCDLLECDAFICLPDLSPTVVASAVNDLLAANDATS